METICEKDKSTGSSDELPASCTIEEDGEKSKTCETEDICEDNKANIRIKVSSTDDVVEDGVSPELIKSNCCVDSVGSNQEKRPIKLQRSDAQDDDVDVESVTMNMKKLTAIGHTTSNGEDGKKNLLSSQGSNDTGSPCLSRDSSTELYTDSTGIDLEKFITDSLQSKDRIFLLGIEKDIISFVKSEEETSYQFDRMNTYHRMLVHRVAAFFGLDHNVDKATESVVVTKTKNTRLPEFKFDDIQVVRMENEVAVEPKKLLKRSDCSGCSLDKSPDRRDLRGNKSQSYEERHEKYVETRARIFAGSHSSGSEDQSNTGDNSLGATASSSQDDVSRGGADKPWSSIESDSSERFKDRNSLHPPVLVKKSRSLEGPVNVGPVTCKVPLQQTKANSWNESSSRGQVCDAANNGRPEWSKSSSANHHQQTSKSYNPRNTNWQPRGDGVPPLHNHNHRHRGPYQQQQQWPTYDPNRVVVVGSHSNPRFKDQTHQHHGEHMILHQVANILGQPDQHQIPNPGMFYHQVMPSGPVQVQQSTHPKNVVQQQRPICNGPMVNYSGSPSTAPLHDGRPNAQNYNQQVFGTVGATSQPPAAGNQIDPRYLYLNPQYSVQNAFGGQNYVLVSGAPQGPGLRGPSVQPTYNPCYNPGQSIMQPSIMTQGSSSMTYIPQPNQMMTIANGSQSNGQGLLPLPYPAAAFQNKPVPQNFQPPLPHQMTTGPPPNTLYKALNQPPPGPSHNVTQPLIVNNPSPVMSHASGQGAFMPGLIVTNPQMNNHQQHPQNVFYGQMCPTAPTRFRHHTGRGHGNR